ncbi:MAG: alanine--tRNA ligase-related protein, partial [Proteobacteria bacterium]|nr:alanine--tRNA ligase-related protein [Pseudomonadota bacterium]
YKRLNQEIKVEFLGYETLKAEGKLLKIIKSGEIVKEIERDEMADLIFERTPFYGESGGQVGDRGVIESDKFVVEVNDTKKVGDLIIHKGVVKSGKVKEGDTATLIVEERLRENTASHHTATHLLQSALQRVLGSHIKQAGSLVEPERFRFDFTHFAPLKGEEIREVEYLVNKWIRENRKVI